MNKYKILLVEDDREISEMLKTYLTTENYEAISCILRKLKHSNLDC